MKKLLAILLCMVMVLSMALLAGCGDSSKSDDDEKSTESSETSGDSGKSEAESEEADGVEGKWEATVDFAELAGEDISVDAEIDVTLNLDSDGTGTLEFDVDQMIDISIEIAEEELAASGMSLEDAGMTREDIADMYEESFSEMASTEVEWDLDGSDLYIDGEKSGIFDGDTLTLDSDGVEIEFTR